MPLYDLARPGKYADAATTKRRQDLCQTCPERTALGRCKQCGCFTNLKTRLTTEKCPLGKW